MLVLGRVFFAGLVDESGAFCLRNTNLSHDSAPPDVGTVGKCNRKSPTPQQFRAVRAAWRCTMICVTFAFNLQNYVLVRKRTKMILKQNSISFLNKGPKVAIWNLLGTPFQALPTCLSICSISRLLRRRLPSSTLFGAHLGPGNVSASKQLCAVQAVYNQEVFPRTPWQCF